MIAVETLAPLVGMMAAERTRGAPELFEDARQEGLIAAWRVASERPEASRQYVTAAARRAVGDVLRGRPPFGASSHRGRREPLDVAGPLAGGVDYGEDESMALADHTAVVALGRVELADTAGEVASAVRLLPERDAQIVSLHFWGERSFVEIARETGTPHSTVCRRWIAHAKPALSEALGHLKGAA